MEVDRDVVAHYEREVDEGRRLAAGLGELELIRTQEIVRRHLPPGSLRLLDVGGGTGVHARWLAADGHTVHVVDPVPRHVAQLESLAATEPLLSAELGDARALSAADGTFDAALLLGPLYHLTAAHDRVTALREACRAVRPGGLVFAAAISRFASLFDGLARGFLFDVEFREVVDRDLAEGQHRNPGHRPHWFTTAFFHHPDDLRAEADAAGLDVEDLVGVEGPAGFMPPLADRWADTDDRDAILYAAPRGGARADPARPRSASAPGRPQARLNERAQAL